MKRCPSCSVAKPYSEYNKALSRKDGVQSICRECGRRKSKEGYVRNRPAFRERAKAQRKREMEYVASLKSKPCMDCGGTFHFAAMDFDHRDSNEKIGTVSYMAGQINRKALDEEIAKCDLVCSNCHRVRTFNRNENNRTLKI